MTAPDRPVFRFAPSPNGYLHLGHAYSALFTAAAAEAAGGRFLLRIEDIDLVRSSQRYVDAILEDLAWLGLAWEEPVRRQSEHFDDYAAALGTLRDLGVVYRCFATRAEIRAAVAADPAHPRDPEGAPLYPGLSKGLSDADCAALEAKGRPFAWRLDAARAATLARARAGGGLSFRETRSGPHGETGELPVDPTLWGDVVVARKDVRTSYHLSVVVDDALQQVTHVTRGQDLFYATHIHRLLQVLLGLPAPEYRHHGLIRDADGRRLSKSARDKALRALRAEGATPADIRRMVGLEAAL